MTAHARRTHDAYRIEGGHPVEGEIRCLGAKNFATKAMIAALLADSPTTLTNVPSIGDVDITVELLTSIGVTVERPAPETVIIDPSTITKSAVPVPHSGSNRVPILLLGALLHRYREVTVPLPGGCNIGARGVDFHVAAVQQCGGRIKQTTDRLIAERSERLRGCHVDLPYPSVGATETCLYLAVLADGHTVISNAAVEPEIQELITMLTFMGANIQTTPGREIIVEGVEQLRGVRMPVLGDRIEAASWACLACASDGDITVHGIRPDTMRNFLSHYQQVGGGMDLVGPTSIRFYRNGEIKPAVIETDVYPGFSTDWQQPFAIVLAQASGISSIHETVYENRFGYLKTLQSLGAKTQLTEQCLGGMPCRYRWRNHEHSAFILGPTDFVATEHIGIPDLRAGLAYVIAAAVARGKSLVTGIHFLERGYGNIVPRLQELNLRIERVPAAQLSARVA